MADNRNTESDNKGLVEIKKEASSAKSLIKFVTRSVNKLKEVTSTLEGDQKLLVTLSNVELNLPELQGSPQDVAKEKCRLAAKEVGGAVLTEETSLCYNALNGLPGVYIKCFLEKTGLDGLNKIISAYEDKTAYAQCIFAYCHGDGFDPELFIGKTDGKVVEARGPQNFGWDPIFQPEGCDKTLAEMDEDEKKKVSHRYKALMLLKEYLKDMAAGDVNEKTEAIKNEDGTIEKMEIKKADDVLAIKKADGVLEIKKADDEVAIKKADDEVETKKADDELAIKKADDEVETKKADGVLEIKKADGEVETDGKKASKKRNREDEDEGDGGKPPSSSIRRYRKIIRSGSNKN